MLALCVAAPVFAQSGSAGKGTPDDLVKHAVESVVKAAKADPVARTGDIAATEKVVTREFLPYTDFQRTTRLAVGNAWKTATPAQQKQLFEQFQTLLVHTYAAQLTQIRDQAVTFQFTPAVLDSKGQDAVVHTSVNSGGDDLQVGYRVEQTADGWKIYDIDMMGAWLILVYQQQFAPQLAQGGVAGLIKYLSDHNARFAR